MNHKRGVALLIALLTLGVTARAQETPPPADEDTVPEIQVSPEVRRVLDGLDEANAKVEDIRAKVTYLREIPLLEESEQSQGGLAFKRPGLIHLELGKPRQEEFYANDSQWWIISHRDKQVEIYEADAGAATTEAAFLTFGYGESSQKLLEEYDITLAGREVQQDREEGAPEVVAYRLSFVPRDEEAPARFARIEIEVADDLWLPRVIQLHESDGEIVHTFRLEDIELNPELEEKDFIYKTPRGYSEIRP